MISLRRIFVPIARMAYRAMPFHFVRAFAFGIYARMVRNKHVVATVDGTTYDLDLGELIDLNLYLGTYEPDVTGAIRRYAKPGMHVLDVGANVGAHTLLIAKLIGEQGRVIGFEPTDFAFVKLERNVSLNQVPQVEAAKVALSDRNDSAVVNFRASWRSNGQRFDAPSTVVFRRLDDFLVEREFSRVDLMKVDIDGNEFPFVVGALQTLERNRPVMIMEAVGVHFDDDARNPFRILESLGYKFSDLKTGQPLTIAAMRDRLPKNDIHVTAAFNLLALPQ